MLVRKRKIAISLTLVFVILFSFIVPLGSHTVAATPVASESGGVVQIAAGGDHALALKADGTVVAWGDNSQGQTNVPVGLSDVVSIAAGWYHSLALKADGTVVAWGRNVERQITVPDGLDGVKSIAAGTYQSLLLRTDGTVDVLGNSSYGLNIVPAGLTDVVSIASGTDFLMAIKSDGTVVAWGNNPNGQTNVGGLTDVVSIAAGPAAYHSLAVKADGSVVAWGASSEGQATIPMGLSNVAAVAAGHHYSLALKSDGTVVAWGRNVPGLNTVPSELSDVVSIAAGVKFSLALKADGTVVAWGSNDYGITTIPADLSLPVKGRQIAAGSFNSLALKSDGTVVGWGSESGYTNNVPNGLTDVASISMRYFHALALKADGTVVGWGSSGRGEITLPTELSGGGVIAIAAGERFSLALKADGTVTGWGFDYNGQATPPGGLSNVVAIAAGTNFSLALKANGTVVGWGYDDRGQATPPSGLSNGVAIAAGERFSLALKADGTVVGWGYNGNGQITIPNELSNVVAIAAGGTHSLALKSDGTVVGWGDNTYGQRSVPAGLSGVVAIAAGSTHSLALKADGTVVGWGINTYGQITIPGNDNLSALTLNGGDFTEVFQSSDTTYTAYFKDALPNSANLTATLNNNSRADLYVNDERVVSGSTVTNNVPGSPTSWDISVRVEPYLKASKTYTVTLAIDETEPSVQFATNGRATAGQTAASTVTVSDTESGVDAASLQYVWTQSTDVPAGGWDTFIDGDTLSQTSGDGSWYLHVRASDKVGNSIDALSNPFVLDNTGPIATLSTSAAGMVNAAFPITIYFNEDINGFTEDDLVIDNGSLSNLVSVTSATYTATVNPTTNGQAVTVTVGAGAVTDEAGNPNTTSNTLRLKYDTAKPAVTFGSFTDGQRFIVPPAAVTVSVSEAVYWVAGGAELSAANALPLITMEMDGHAFSDYTPSYDELSRTYTLSFNGTLADGDYEVLVAGNAVSNVYHNTLDAASASFTVAVPVITGITAASTDFSNAGGYTTVAIAGVNLLGQTVNVYMDGVDIATATVDNATGATANVVLPLNGTYSAKSHILTVYLNGVEASGQSLTFTVRKEPDPVEEPQPSEGPQPSEEPQKEVTPPSKEEPGSTQEAGCPFVDIRTHWARATICEAASLGIVEGVNAQNFAPNRHITRAELVVMLQRILQTPASQEPSVLPFSDKESIPAWAEAAISIGVSKGVFNGYPDGTFRPQQTINRSEMAVMIAKAMGWQAGSERYLTYTDGASVPGWASASVEAVLVKGLMQGRGGNLFVPLGLTTRAEAAVVMLKLWHTQQQ